MEGAFVSIYKELESPNFVCVALRGCRWASKRSHASMSNFHIFPHKDEWELESGIKPGRGICGHLKTARIPKHCVCGP